MGTNFPKAVFKKRILVYLSVLIFCFCFSIAQLNAITEATIISAGASYAFGNVSPSSSSITVNASSSGNRIYDYAVYNSDGSVYAQGMGSTNTSFTVPAGGTAVVTVVSTSNDVTFSTNSTNFVVSQSSTPALNRITALAGESYEFVNLSTVSGAVLTNGNSSANRVFDYAVYKNDGTAYAQGMLSTDTSITVPGGGKLIVTVHESSSATTFGRNYSYSAMIESTNPALNKVTALAGESYEFLNTSSLSSSIITNGNSSLNRRFDYASYKSDGTTYEQGISSTTTSISVSSGGKLVLTVLESANATTFGSYYDNSIMANSANPALVKVTANAGESYELINIGTVNGTVTVNGSSSSNRIYDYVVYKNDGTVYAQVMASTNTSITIPGGGKLIISVLESSTAITFGANYINTSVRMSENPALNKIMLDTAESYEVINTGSVSSTIMTNGSSSANRKFDYVTYRSDGTIYEFVKASTSASISVPALGKIVIALSDYSLPITIGGSYNMIQLRISENMPLIKLELIAGQSYGFYNSSSSIDINIKNSSSSSGSRYDFATLTQNGNYNFASNNYGDISVVKGGYTVITVLGQTDINCWYPRKIFIDSIRLTEPSNEALYKFELTAGKSYKFENSSDYSTFYIANNSSSSARKYNYMRFNSNGDIVNKANTYGDIAINSDTVVYVSVLGEEDLSCWLPMQVKQDYITYSEGAALQYCYPADMVYAKYNPGVSTQFNDFYGANNSSGGPYLVNINDVLLGKDTTGSFVSLPTGSFVVLGFRNPIINVEGVPDIYIKETGIMDEEADVYVSTVSGELRYLGSVVENKSVMSLDLESIDCNEPIIAVMVVGKDEGGSSPGFDVVEVSGINDASIIIDNAVIEAAFTKIINSFNSMAVNSGLTESSIENNESINFTQRQQDFPDSQISDPVDAATGAQVISRNLLSVKGIVDIDFNMQYNSLLLKEGLLGKAWGHNYEAHIEEVDVGNIIIHWTANSKTKFTKNEVGEFIPAGATNSYDKVIKNEAGEYTVKRKDLTSYKFNGAGKLIEVINNHKQVIKLIYDINSRLVTILESISGKSISVEYNNLGLIKNVNDDLNRFVSFAYDSQNNLTTVTDAKGYVTSYSHNEIGQIAAATHAGIRIFRNTFDDYGRVIAQDDAKDGNALTMFKYDETSNPGRIITTVTDRNGKTKVLTHDSNYFLISLKNEIGSQINYTYDALGNRLSMTDSRGQVTRFTYDNRGNLLAVSDTLNNTTTMTYDANNNLLTIQNTLGKSEVFTYDSNNNLISKTNYQGDTISYAYNINSQLITKTDSDGYITAYTYQNGILQKQKNGDSTEIFYEYDSVGRLSSITQPSGKKIFYTYDSLNNITSISTQDATKQFWQNQNYVYDHNSNLVEETNARGYKTRYSYDLNGRLIFITDALWNNTEFYYDGEDRLIRVTDANGNTTMTMYDAKGRKIEVIDALLNRTQFKYDGNDNLLEVIGPLGNTISSFTYDLLDNLTSTTNAIGIQTQYNYDQLDRLIQKIDPLGKVTRFEYNDLNRLVSVNDSKQGISSQTYNLNGQITNIYDVNNNQTSFTYDSLGRITSQGTTSGKLLEFNYNGKGLLDNAKNGRGQATNYKYDGFERLIELTDSEGTISYTYDANGNILTAKDEVGTISYEYDSLDRVTKYTDVRGNIIQYKYDKVGNLVCMAYPDLKEVNYEYDKLNHLTKVTDWANRVTTYEYDRNSCLVKTIRPNGSIQTLSYDAAGQLIIQSDVDKNGNIICSYSFTYDDSGNVINEQSNVQDKMIITKKSNLTYGNGNQLKTYNGQNVMHDDDGNMIYGPLNQSMTSFQYDSRNRLVEAGNLNYIYDVGGNRVSVVNGTVITNYVINPISAFSQVLVEEDDSSNANVYYIYGLGLIGQEDKHGAYRVYHFDRRGSTAALSSLDGQISDRYTYDSYGEVLTMEGETRNQFLYNGRDGVITDNNGLYYMRARYYNPEIKRFISPDQIIGSISDSQTLNRYQYVSGKPITHVDPLGKFNIFSEIYDGAVSLKYDAIRDYEAIKYYGGKGVNVVKTFSGNLAAEAKAVYIDEGISAPLDKRLDQAFSQDSDVMGALIMTGGLVETHVMAVSNIMNPMNVGRVLTRATIDSAYDPQRAKELKMQANEVFDVADIIKAPKDIYGSLKKGEKLETLTNIYGLGKSVVNTGYEVK